MTSSRTAPPCGQLAAQALVEHSRRTIDSPGLRWRWAGGTTPGRLRDSVWPALRAGGMSWQYRRAACGA